MLDYFHEEEAIMVKNDSKETLKSTPLVKYEPSDGRDRIFISYQRNSLSFVLTLSRYLESHGVKVWYAPRNIKFGAFWASKLNEAISNCKALLLLYSDEADKSLHVLREVNLADTYHKTILWVKFSEEETHSVNLKYYLNIVQTMTWEKRNEAEFLDLITGILSKPKIDYDALTVAKGVSSGSSTLELPIKPWGKGLYVFKTPEEAGECVARLYFAIGQAHPNSTLLLPTGRSAKTIFYAMIRNAHDYPGCPFGDADLMNDTETFGVTSRHPTSRIKGIVEGLIEPLRDMGKAPKANQLTFFAGVAGERDPEVEAAEALKAHPIAMAAVSVSPYCEVIGYEFGAHDIAIIHDGPKALEVTDQTKDYIDCDQKTNYLYSVGLGSLLASPLLLLLAFDEKKGDAIERLYKEESDPSAPITLLRNHPNAYCIITEDVAKKAGLEAYAIRGKSPKEVAECILQNRRS
jgi:6-phosphogluconolactonase/glucosamine-6-phosphate isomerase/deaminase